MQVHTVRCQKLAWPLFHKIAKVRVPLCGTRLAEGSIRSAWMRGTQRYRFDVTSLFSRAALFQAATANQPCVCASCCAVLWCDDEQAKGG